MNLTELKKKSIAELLAIAKEMGLDNMARSRKQDIIFAILKTHARNGEAIYGDGVLEVLPDGFGFLRFTTLRSLLHAWRHTNCFTTGGRRLPSKCRSSLSTHGGLKF